MKLWLDGVEKAVERFSFSGGEIQVRINDLPFIFNDAFIEQNIRSSDDLMEVLLVTNAVRQHSGHGHLSVNLCCPYLPYARQDRVCCEGEALSLQVICDIINSQNYATVETWDVHSDVALALLRNHHDVPLEIIFEGVDFFDIYGACNLISPDRGASKKTERLAKKFGMNWLQAEKHRDPRTGEITHTQVHFEKAHKLLDKFGWNLPFLIVDDICDGGRTFIEIAKAPGFGNHPKIWLYVTHGIFSKGLKCLQEAGIERVFSPNPWPVENFLIEKDTSFLTVLEL